MRLYTLLFVLFLFLCESAVAGILVRIPNSSVNGGRRTARLSTTPLRATNPPIEHRSRENDVTYYFSHKRAQEQYEKDIIRWERDRVAQIQRFENEKARAAAFRRRSSGMDAGAARMINASAPSTNIHADPKAVSSDPRAWFKNKIAGSFGPRPSSQHATVLDTGDKSVTAKASKSSSALLEDQPVGDANEAVRKEGLWSKFLRVLGLKK